MQRQEEVQSTHLFSSGRVWGLTRFEGQSRARIGAAWAGKELSQGTDRVALPPTPLFDQDGRAISTVFEVGGGIWKIQRRRSQAWHLNVKGTRDTETHPWEEWHLKPTPRWVSVGYHNGLVQALGHKRMECARKHLGKGLESIKMQGGEHSGRKMVSPKFRNQRAG